MEECVKITRMSGLVALLAVGALTLSACGSDNNTASTTSAAAATSAAGSAASSMASGASAAASSAADGAAPTFEGSGFSCATGSLRSSGSTAQGKVMEQWI